MKTFTYNDLSFSLEPDGGKWNIACQRGEGKTAYVAVGVLPGVAESEVLERARRLVRAIRPVGVRIVGPDVARPLRIGDLKIVGPDVGHPNFIYWDKDSASFPG